MRQNFEINVNSLEARMKNKMIVFVTAGNEETSEKIARALVDEHLAACVNIVSKVRSFYRWEGKVVDDSEWLLLIKTTQNRFADLKKRVLALHTYELPEIVGLTIEEGHEEYLAWIEKETAC
jgi:periplasmic divalent cation tolerance protein